MEVGSEKSLITCQFGNSVQYESQAFLRNEKMETEKIMDSVQQTIRNS
jgi:hypothetical protein